MLVGILLHSLVLLLLLLISRLHTVCLVLHSLFLVHRLSLLLLLLHHDDLGVLREAAVPVCCCPPCLCRRLVWVVLRLLWWWCGKSRRCCSGCSSCLHRCYGAGVQGPRGRRWLCCCGTLPAVPFLLLQGRLRPAMPVILPVTPLHRTRWLLLLGLLRLRNPLLLSLLLLLVRRLRLLLL